MKKSNVNAKKRICWVTVSWFLNVDIPIVPLLSKHFQIDWKIIFFLGDRGNYTVDDFYKQADDVGLCRVEIIQLAGSGRSPSAFVYYCKLLRQIQSDYDVAYINTAGYPYFFLLASLYRVKEKLVYACHDVTQHVSTPALRRHYQNFILNSFENFQFFSKNQFIQFSNNYRCKKCFVAGLPLPDFGSSGMYPPENKVVFTFFGKIRANKGLERLIKAGNLLTTDEDCQNKFVIHIAGHHSDFDEVYGKYILDKSYYNLDIRKIPNAEIPDIMCSSHYLVLPYKDITQSGPMLIAYSYNLPVIGSALDGFSEYIIDGYNGFLFDARDPSALYHVMKNCICNKNRYNEIKDNLKTFVNSNLSNSSILEKYIEFFKAI